MQTVQEVLVWLERRGSPKGLQDMARYGIVTGKAYGVPMGELKAYAKKLGTSHELAGQLWDSGWYEARALAAFIGDPALVTVGQMNRWAAAFDNWGTVDTVCFSLFDRAPHAWKVLPKWAKAKGEFQKRAAFALIWSLTVHDKQALDQAFLECLALIEREAGDERHFVKKAVNMALRAVGKRNRVLHDAAVETAKRLASSENAAASWNGRDALRELRSQSILKRIKAL